MLTFKTKDLPPNHTLEQRLDVEVNRASLCYYGASLRFEDTRVTWPYIEEADNTFLKLIFISDARAQCEPERYADNKELAWVEVAVDGLRRLSTAIPAAGA